MSTPLRPNNPLGRPYSQEGLQELQRQREQMPQDRENMLLSGNEQGQGQVRGQGRHSNGTSPALPPNQLSSSADPTQSPGQDVPQQQGYPRMMHQNMMPFMPPMHMQQMLHQQQQQQLFFAQQHQHQQLQQQLHLQQQQHQLQQKQQQESDTQQEELSDSMAGMSVQTITPDNTPDKLRLQEIGKDEAGEFSPRLHPSLSPASRDGDRRSPMDRHSIGSMPFGMGMHNPMMQHPSMFNTSGNPNFDPSMVPVQTPSGLVFVPMNRMTPPPGFGPFPMPIPVDQGRAGLAPPPPAQGAAFHPNFQQQQQQLHHQMLMQQQQHPNHRHQHQQYRMLAQSQHGATSPVPHDALHHDDQAPDKSDSNSGPSQQHQIKDIENQINHLLFRNDSLAVNPSLSKPSHFDPAGSRPLSGHVTVQEIEKAQELNLHNLGRRVSLADTMAPPRSKSTLDSDASATPISKSAHDSESVEAVTISSKVSFNSSSIRHADPTQLSSTQVYDSAAVKAPFSVKDIDFYSDRKYDPYRPSSQTFDQITRDASILCHELLPKPAEETRKLALLQRLSEIATATFGEAEVLPFGSSGNGLALANADMDVCVFLNVKEGEQEVSPAEFVERIGDRLEKETDFENVLQLRKARVPIVKLNHLNGIACDIGYQNDLAIWNTRLLRSYCKVDRRVREIVVIVKQWAKRRRINNPYTGSLSSYAYVLLVIHVLQRRGVLPNLQTTVEGHGQVPFWNCQGFNRYFFEDISRLPRFWQPTPESLQQSVGELLYEFFRYFASEFRYATHVVSIRKGGLLTKEMKEWTKDQTQAQAESKPQTNVKNRYLFCIEDPFELDHNIGRPVDRYSLFTIRGEFMRAAKILSRNGDGAISRLCVERHVPPPPEKPRTSSIDHGDDRVTGRRGSTTEHAGTSKAEGNDSNVQDGSPPVSTFAAGEDLMGRQQRQFQGQENGAPPLSHIPVGTASPEPSNNSSSASSSNSASPRNGRHGRRHFHKRATITGGESRPFSAAVKE
ncbi:hypothetical protein BG004_007602 [Podila humilis]|nr:hypothetical protein BG004_007602 [Podila humilis]